MHSASHALFDTARHLWLAYAALGVVVLFLCWVDRTNWAKRLLVLETLVALILGSTFLWFPAEGHDANYDLFGTFLWSGVALGSVAATLVLALICREIAVSRRRRRGASA